MNVLLLGSGGRESAFAWKIAQSNLCKQLFIAPGNGGTQQYGKNIDLNIHDFSALKDFCIQHEITILLPGGEDTLVEGIYDFFKSDPDLKHIIVVGPSQEGAQLEGSKAFAKKFMQRHQIPTAAYQEFNINNYEAGLQYLENHSLPIVLKADGLAAGKGVVITSDVEEAKSVFTSMIKEAAFGSAGDKVVVEAFLTGVELSVFAFSDGENYVLLPEAKDYKRIGEGETGLNTGGMGAVSPVPFAKGAFMEKVIRQIVEPTVQGLKSEKITYTGFIFFGLINVNGDPFVIEYNCRMGDPETEVVIPRLENDLVDLFQKMEHKALHEVKLQFKKEAAATVMLVSAGYPGSYEKGKKIGGLNNTNNSIIFQAGTKIKDTETITNGGRVLAITSFGDDLENALETSFQNAEKIHFEGKNYRKDIGFEFLGNKIKAK